jgi:uncharacterized membrane protein YgcG
MEGATATSHSLASVGQSGRRPGVWLLVAGAIAAVVAFAAAYAIGNATKKTTPHAASTQLQSPSSLQGAQHVQITAVGAAGAIPGLKPKPAPPKPKSKPNATTTTAAPPPQTQTAQPSAPPITTSPRVTVAPSPHFTPSPSPSPSPSHSGGSFGSGGSSGSSGSSSSGSSGSSSSGSSGSSSGSG